MPLWRSLVLMAITWHQDQLCFFVALFPVLVPGFINSLWIISADLESGMQYVCSCLSCSCCTSWVMTWRGIRSAFIVEKDSLHWYVMTLQSLRHVYMWCAQMFVHVWGECWSVDIDAVYVCLSICSSTQLGPLNLLSSTSRLISCIGVSESCCHT